MSSLDGAWEPKGYIGPRVEIEGKKLVRLWHSSPVLTTKFTMEKDDNRTVLKLKNTNLCYVGAVTPYATVKECYLQGEALVFVDDFPITGESRNDLYRTNNSRYGNVTIVDKELLPILKGIWKCEAYDMILSFDRNKMKFGYGEKPANEVEIVTIRYNTEGDSASRYIIDKDPARAGVGMFDRITFRNGELHTFIPVCDAPAVTMIFKKIKD